MTNESIHAQLASIIEEVAGVPAADITADKSLKDDLDVDSLSMVEVVVSIEDKYGVSLSDDALEHLHTVGDVVDYIEKAAAPTPA